MMVGKRQCRGVCLLLAIALAAGWFSPARTAAEDDLSLGDIQVEEGVLQEDLSPEEEAAPPAFDLGSVEATRFYQGEVTDIRTAGVTDGHAWTGTALFQWDIRRPIGRGISVTFTQDTVLQPGDLALLTTPDGKETTYTEGQLAGRTLSWNTHAVTLSLLLAENTTSHLRVQSMRRFGYAAVRHIRPARCEIRGSVHPGEPSPAERLPHSIRDL